MSLPRFILIVLLFCYPLSGFCKSNYTVATYILPGINRPARPSIDLTFVDSKPVFGVGCNLELAKIMQNYKLGIGVGFSEFGTKIEAKKTYENNNVRTVSQSNSSHFVSVNLLGQRRLITYSNIDFAVFLGASATFIIDRATNLATNGTQILSITLNSVSTTEGVHIAPIAGVTANKQFRKFFVESRLGYRVGLKEITSHDYTVRESGTRHHVTISNSGSSLFFGIGMGVRI